MNTVNPWPLPALPSDGRDTAANGGAHQQRWLQDLERTWLRSWQQASPAAAGEAASPEPAGATPRPAGGGLPTDARTAGSARGLAPAAQTRSATDEHARPEQAVSATLAPQAAQARAASMADDSAVGASDTAGRVLPATFLHVPPMPSAPRGELAPARSSARSVLPAPAAPTPQASSLHVREAGADSVMAALRDSRLGAAASQAAADALARQLAQAGYAQVQVYVNGTALRRQAAEPQAPHQEKPHGH